MEIQTVICLAMAIASALITVVYGLSFSVSGIEGGTALPLAILAWAVTGAIILYAVYTYIVSKTPKDLWKLGWAGALGFSGFIPGLSPLFFGLYGFFIFFGFVRNDLPNIGFVRNDLPNSRFSALKR